MVKAAMVKKEKKMPYCMKRSLRNDGVWYMHANLSFCFFLIFYFNLIILRHPKEFEKRSQRIKL